MSEFGNFPYKDYAQLYPIRMLVADDRPEDLTTMSIFLESMGYSPSYALNGIEVLESLEAGVYDMIFMDVKMPQLGGIDATQMIRRRESDEGVKRGAYIVGFTAFDEEDMQEKCMEVGMNGYFHKPIELANLVKLVEACAEWMALKGVK